MSGKSPVDRRTFLKASAMAVAAATLSACGATPTATPVPPTPVPPTATKAPAPAAPTATTAPAPAAPTATKAPAPAATAAPTAAPATAPGAFKEAPMLAELVKAGKLPSVDKRLPPSPLVIKPIAEVGKYGGTIRTAIPNVNQLFGDPQSVIGTEQVLRIGRDFSSIVPGLFESWEFNNNATQQTLKLRRGLKWSDGSPMTTADCLFDWEDCKNNKELAPAGPPSAWKTGPKATPMQMKALDDYTLQLTFTDPYPLIILQQGFYAGCQNGGMFNPKNYLKQFHPKYTDAAIVDKAAKDAKFDTWVQHFNAKALVGSTIPAAVGLPGMTAFIRTADDPSHHTYERNPYYWKVDSAGNQLPYIDKVVIEIIQDPELITTKLLAGNFDFIGNQAYLKNMELYKKSLTSAKLKLLMWDSTLVAAVLLYPNMTTKDKELRDFFQRKNVRYALSMAMNRKEINDVVHFGLGQPRQVALWPTSIYYQKGDEAQKSEYDKAKANALLDQEGFTKKDAQGYRLFPSGKRIGWTAEYDQAQGDIAPTLELCIQYWKDIGVELQIKPLDRNLLNQRFLNNDEPFATWQGDIGSDIVFPISPKIMHGNSEANALGWGRAWEAWMTQKGQFPQLEEEPPDWVKAQYTDWTKFQSTYDEKERIKIMRGLWDRFYDYLPCWGTVGVPQPILVNQALTNIPEKGVFGFGTIRMVPVNPEQFFFKT